MYVSALLLAGCRQAPASGPLGPTPWVIPVMAVVLIPLVGGIISYASGWRKLAERFRYELPYGGLTFFPASAKIGGCNYNNCLTFGSGHDGLYVRVMWIFRWTHPSLLIPWNEITVSRRKILWWNFWVLTCGSAEQVRLQVPEALGEKLRLAAGPAWPVETLG